MLAATSAKVPPPLGWDRIKVSKNLGATAPGVTSLPQDFIGFPCKSFEQFGRQNLVRKVNFNLLQVQYNAKGCLVTFWLTFQKKSAIKLKVGYICFPALELFKSFLPLSKL